MARALRSDLPDGFYHVTGRGVAKTKIFRDSTDRLAFLLLLRRTIDRFRWKWIVFCLMSTHYHVVIEATREDLSRGMHRLNGLYAQQFNARYARRGHLFGDRFSAWLIESEDHLTATCRYVLLNPVRAGLCGAIEDWPWSGTSYRGASNMPNQRERSGSIGSSRSSFAFSSSSSALSRS